MKRTRTPRRCLLAISNTPQHAALSMHFALPPRKGTVYPPYARAAARISATRRTKRFRFAGYCLLGLLTIWLIVRYTLLSGSSSSGVLDEDIETNIVIVTVIDDDNETVSPEYVRKIKANRDDYASRHGMYQNIPRKINADCSICRVHQLLRQRFHVQDCIHTGSKVMGTDPSSPTCSHSPPASDPFILPHTARIHHELQSLVRRSNTEPSDAELTHDQRHSCRSSRLSHPYILSSYAFTDESGPDSRCRQSGTHFIFLA